MTVMAQKPIRIIGIDPGLQRTGWGVIDVNGSRLSHVANGVVRSTQKKPLADRLVEISTGLDAMIALWKPEQAAVEETFVNKDPISALKLGAARGVALLIPAQSGLVVAEYAANVIKKSIVGAGHASKDQVEMMVRTLLPTADIANADAADALAIAICHAHHGATQNRMQNIVNSSGEGVLA